MGLDDRDYLHQRREPAPAALRPPAEPSVGGILARMVIGVLVLAGLYKASDYLWEWRGQAVIAAPALEAPRAPAGPVLPSTAFAEPSPSPQAPAKTFSKCTAANGRVSYSDGACPPGSRRSPLQLVPEQNLVRGERAPSALPVLPPVPATRRASPAVAEAPDATAQQCQRLAQRVVQLDAQARRPQDPQYQDWLRTERQAARDQQFRLQCS
ncbi:hypothetical protein AAFF27_00175 [Xylophilus sp. GW821-FHT01B05]